MAQNFFNKSAKLLMLLPSRPITRSMSHKSSIADKFRSAKKDPNWAELECCNETQKQFRLDDKMPARRNHKGTQKHWKDCKEQKPKKVYTCADRPADSKPKRRARKDGGVLTTCRQPLPSKRASICLKPKIDTCPRIQMPGCLLCRQPAVCFKHKKTIECRKLEAPVPSFYETIKKGSPASKREKCLVRDSVCPEKSPLNIATK